MKCECERKSFQNGCDFFVLFYACFINKCFRVQLHCISFVVNLILLNKSFPIFNHYHYFTGY